ncbi:MAG: hypothetical protein WD226_08985 [Planctomycetota bacterium]
MKPSLPQQLVRSSLLAFGALTLLAGASVARTGASVSGDSADEPWDAHPWSASESRALRYSYLEGSYLLSDVGDFSDEADGWKLEASLGIADSFRFFASLADSELNQMGAKIDETNLVVGVGYHAPIAPNLDWTLDLAYLEEDTRREVGQGLGVDLGARWRPTRLLEFSAGGLYHLYDDNDVGEDADGIGFRAEGHLWVQDKLSIFARYEALSVDVGSNNADRDNLQIGLRLAL